MTNDHTLETMRFARYHNISVIEAEAYNDGRDKRSKSNAPVSVRSTRAIDLWFSAGWHDRDIEMGYSVL